jgi:hypothetical protein
MAWYVLSLPPYEGSPFGVDIEPSQPGLCLTSPASLTANPAWVVTSTACAPFAAQWHIA